jgi:hypothetical protein
MSRHHITTVYQLMSELIKHEPDTQVCITTPDHTDPGWDDLVIGAIDFDEHHMVELQAVIRPA